jgi:hypothetical protein
MLSIKDTIPRQKVKQSIKENPTSGNAILLL